MSASETKAWTKLYAPWTDHELEYGDDTLASIYDRNLELNADKPASYFFGRGQSYKELDQQVRAAAAGLKAFGIRPGDRRSEEHTSELQSRGHLVCRLLLEKKKTQHEKVTL